MNLEESKNCYFDLMNYYKREGKRTRIKIERDMLNPLESLIKKYDPEIEVIYNSTFQHKVHFISNEFELLLRSDNAPVHTLVVVKIKVSPPGKGIGSIILEELMSYAKKVGFERVVLEQVISDEGINFAQKNGFSRCYTPSMELKEFNFETGIGNYERFIYFNSAEAITFRIKDLCQQNNLTIYGLAKKIERKYEFNIQSTLNEILQKRTKSPQINTLYIVAEAFDMRLCEFFNDRKFDQIEGVHNN